MSDLIEACVVGAGVIGLAVARELALSGREVLVLERSPRFGEGISSRNSEVIHAGIYYPAESLKARYCVRGKVLLYEYCEARSIGHKRIGKLIVATSLEEERLLEGIEQRARANGVSDLEFLSEADLKSVEPMLNAKAALLSPSTGIVSAAELMTSLLADIESCGGTLATHADVMSIEKTVEGYRLNCCIEGEAYELQSRVLVNAAGLGAQQLAGSIDAMEESLIPKLHLCKGNYFTYQGRSPFNRLIYPVPEPGGAGLGVHATLDLGGQVKFGPDVEYIDEENYVVSGSSLEKGIRAIRKYFPELDTGKLVPGYAGIRPKLQGPGEAVADFVIQGPDEHGLEGLVNLFGIESPGLTSSMAIAETVAAHYR